MSLDCLRILVARQICRIGRTDWPEKEIIKINNPLTTIILAATLLTETASSAKVWRDVCNMTYRPGMLYFTTIKTG